MILHNYTIKHRLTVQNYSIKAISNISTFTQCCKKCSELILDKSKGVMLKNYCGMSESLV